MKRKKLEKQLLSLGLAFSMAFQMPMFDLHTPIAVKAAESTTNSEKQVVYTEYKGTGAAHGNGTAQLPYKFLKDALAAVPEGGTIIIGAEGAYVNDDDSNSAPLVIDKKVTIKSESNAILDTRSGGIVLGADVTFQNVKLGFENKCNNAIFANGHTLTLNNVSQASGYRTVHLFAGGLSGSGAVPGNHGKIVINGSAAQFGNIYGGSMNEASSMPATITVNGESGMSIGEVYACGARTGYYDPNSLFDLTDPEVPAANSGLYPVSQKVTIELNNSGIKKVHGLASENNKADVVYSTVYPRSPEFSNLDTLTIKSGEVIPVALNEGVNLVIHSKTNDTNGGILDLSTITANNDMTFTVGNFTGGGTLALGEEDVLTITGEITGSTIFEVSGALNGSAWAKENHGYIDASMATGDGVFTFTPYDTQGGMTLTNQNGIWTTSGEENVPTHDFKVLTFDVKETKLEFTPEEIMGFYAGIGITGTISEEVYVYPSDLNFSYELTYGGKEYQAVSTTDGFSYKGKVADLNLLLEPLGEFDKDTAKICVGCIDEANPINSGTYQLTIHAPTETGTVTKQVEFTILGEETPQPPQENVTVSFEGGVQTLKDQVQTTDFTYGDIVTLKVTPKITPESTVTTNTTANNTELSSNQVALFLGDVQLTEPQNVTNGKELTFTIDTSKKQFSIGENILTVKYQGDSTTQPAVPDYQENISITVHKKPLQVTSATAVGRPYNETNVVTVSGVLLSGLVGSDDVEVDTTGLTGTISSANVGSYDKVTLPALSLMGEGAENYTLTQPTETVNLTASIEIKKKDGETTPPEVIGNYAESTAYENRYCYTITPIVGAEYQMDGQEEGKWQDSNVFDNIESGSSHTFYARIKETANVEAGAVGNTGVVNFDKQPGQATVTIQGWQYGSTANAPSVTSATHETDGVIYQYKEKDGSADTYTETVPVKAGTYTVKAIFPETDTHSGVMTTADFTITKAPLSVSKTTGMGKKYDGRNTIAITNVLLEGVIERDNKVDEVSVDTTGLTGTVSSANAGSYDKVTLPALNLTGEDAGNYILTQPTEAVNLTASIEITKKDGETTPPEVIGNYAESTTYENRYCYTITPIPGAEYQMDGQEEGKWQDSNVFDNIESGSSHTFYARIKETANVEAGAVGNTGVVVFEKEESDSGENGEGQNPGGENGGNNSGENGESQNPGGDNSENQNPDAGNQDQVETPEKPGNQEQTGTSGNSGTQQRPGNQEQTGISGNSGTQQQPGNQEQTGTSGNLGTQQQPGTSENHGTIKVPGTQQNPEDQDTVEKEDDTEDKAEEALQKGKTFQVNNLIYKVVASDRSKKKFEVSCVKVTSKKIKKVKLSSHVTYKDVEYKVVGIEKNAFSGCSKLKTVTIGNNITNIGNKAFYKCVSLKKITIPSNVAKIGKSAFAGCKKLKSITVKTSKLKKASIGKNAFQGISAKATIKVPKKQLKLYKKIWKGVGKKVRFKA